MTITFYNSPTCPYCIKAKQMFAAELSSGEMIEKHANQAPKEVRGFPTFEANGKLQSGLPQTKEELYSKLGVYKEKYMHRDQPPIPSPIDWTKLYINKVSNGKAPNPSNFYIYIPFQKINDPTIVGCLIGLGKNVYYSHVFSPTVPDTTKITIASVNMSKLPLSVSPQDIENVLIKLFPCTSIADWDNIFNVSNPSDIQSLLAKLLPNLLPPKPCKSDKNVYCCPGNDVKQIKFFDMKTISMIIIIILLMSILLYISMSDNKSTANSSLPIK